VTAYANGIGLVEGIFLEDFHDVLDLHEATRRTIRRSKWVEEYRLEDAAASFDGLM